MELNREKLEELVSKELVVSKFLEIIKIHGPSRKELNVAEYMVTELKNLGAEIYLDKGYENYGGNAPVVFAKFKGSIDGEGISLNAHMDVIEPHANVKTFMDGDIIRTDGTTTLGGDDRAGCASILETIRILKENDIPHKDIFVMLTPCEEDGLQGAKNIDWDSVPENMKPAKHLLVVDNAGRAGLVAHTGPAMYQYEIRFKGRKAHAGIEPENGINAIQLASTAISNMCIGRIDKLTTSNIGNIVTEGPLNVVPDVCIVRGETRGHSEERLAEILDSYKKACKDAVEKLGGEFEFEAERDFPTLKPKDDLKFAKEFAKVYDEIGVESELQVIGGGSDCNIFASSGFESVIIGVGMSDVHTTEESLNTNDLYLTTMALVKYLSSK